MPRWPKIFVDRHGFSQIPYTKGQFLRAVRNADEFFEIQYRRQRGDPRGYVPHGKIKRGDIDTWMALLGAVYTA